MTLMHYTLSRQHMAPQIWEGYPGVPIMAPASTCYSRQTNRLRAHALPLHCRPLAADSGGFVFATKYADYPFSPADYIAWCEQLQPDWAACMDYPVEIELAPHESQVRTRQEGAIRHAHTLLAYQGSWHWLPVIQGRTIDQYLWHVEQYKREGLVTPYMGIGSLCRRTSVHEIESIASAISAELPGTEFHLFGVKLQLFKRPFALPEAVASADTAAWNGMFGEGRYRWKEAQASRGITQRVYEIEQLYLYKQRVDRAFAQPKQLALAAS